MSHRGAVVTLLAVFAIVMLAPAPATSQAGSPTSPTAHTAWGDPDLQGYWTGQTFTPLQRPVHLAGREFFTEEEWAELQRILTAEGVDPLALRSGENLGDADAIRQRLRQTRESIHYDNSTWLRTGRPKGLSSRRTSLVLDPPDGRIPPLTPAAQRRVTERAEAMRGHEFDSYESRPLQERCVVWATEGPPMMPPPYNDVLQIVQTPGYVAILQELGTNRARIIPVSSPRHVSPNIRQVRGDSRGRWEGETLVVETTNFTDKTRFQGATGPRPPARAYARGAALHVLERFTRVDANMIRYEFTVDDPTTWTRPWRAEIPMMKTEGPLYEYACHEGNYDIRHILEVAREVEAKAAQQVADSDAR